MDSVRITRKKLAYSADLEHLQDTIRTAQELGAPVGSAGTETSGR